MTIGNVPQNPFAMEPRLSEVEGVDQPGEQFMRAVFSLPQGGVGVAANEPQTIVYVVQLAEYARPLDELRRDFAAEQPMRYLGVAREDQRQLYLAWLDKVEKAADVHWLRPADQSVRGASDEGPSPDDMDF